MIMDYDTVKRSGNDIQECKTPCLGIFPLLMRLEIVVELKPWHCPKYVQGH
jgi:hypothetical protein